MMGWKEIELAKDVSELLEFKLEGISFSEKE